VTGVVRVVVADDEPLIRAGITTVLSSAPGIEVVAQAGDGHAAVTEVLRHRPDVALVDLRMPALSGLGVLAELGRQASGVRVVVLTSFDSEANVQQALAAGAVGFVLKNCAPDELIRAVRAAYEGAAYLSPSVTRLVLGMLTPTDPARRQRAAQRVDRLTPREAEVAALVAEGLSNAEIGRRLHASEPTVKTYVSRILTKLDCANRVQAALLVRDAGSGP